MATTIRVYIDGGGTPYATGTMNADRSFSVPVAGLANGSHTIEVTAQEDGKGESPRAIQTITVNRGTGVEHPLAGDLVASAESAADLTASGAPTQHALAASINVTGTVTADLTLAFQALYGSASASATAGGDLTAGVGGGTDLTIDFESGMGPVTLASGSMARSTTSAISGTTSLRVAGTDSVPAQWVKIDIAGQRENITGMSFKVRLLADNPGGAGSIAPTWQLRTVDDLGGSYPDFFSGGSTNNLRTGGSGDTTVTITAASVRIGAGNLEIRFTGASGWYVDDGEGGSYGAGGQVQLIIDDIVIHGVAS